ncbi:MAG TPA: Trk system potassium transporter TrkA [Lachnospiraceae bacterium]|nr:Trk system potassium transporter TrkA [Lachnospiraceae bacterium]
MQIMIVGCGKVGINLTEQLTKEGHNITVIDQDRSIVTAVSNKYDVMGVVGNGTSYSVQAEAGLKDTDLVIAVAGSDELNLLCCLIAKKMGNCNTIARVRNPIYSKEIDVIREELGLSMVINPELAASFEMARLLRFPSAMKIETFAKGRVEIIKMVIGEDSPLHELSVMEITTKLKCDVLICAVERGEEVTIPNGSFVLQAGDVVSVVASPKNSGAFFKKMGFDTHQVKDAMIVGGGEISYYLASQLLSMGISVKIIELKKERCEELSVLLPKAVIINGDAIDQNILMEEDLKHAQAFVSLTNIDEENILLSLFAKSESNAKIITKINRISFDNVISNLNLGSVIYPKHVTAEYILRYVRAMQNSIGSNIETLYQLIEDKVEALEFVIRQDAPVIGIPLEKLNLKKNLLLCSINRKGQIITPRGQDMMQLGDTVIIVTSHHGLDDIADILE